MSIFLLFCMSVFDHFFVRSLFRDVVYSVVLSFFRSFCLYFYRSLFLSFCLSSRLPALVLASSCFAHIRLTNTR